MIIILFLIGYVIGVISAFIGNELPTHLPYIEKKDEPSWILNLFYGIISGIVLVIAYNNYDLGYEFFTIVLLDFLIINIFVSDIKYYIILDSPLVISGIILLILKFIYFGFKTALFGLLSGLGLFLFMLVIASISKKIFKKEALGGGDIKLAIIIGILLNLRLGLAAIIISSLLALPYALASIMLNHDKEVAYGPFLASGMALVFIFTDKFTNLINFLI